MEHFRDGIRQFQTTVFPQLRETYETLAASQSPRALFIACSDSRVNPEFITQSGPGEIFVARNPGNLVPPYSQESDGIFASVEYALAVLKVPEIAICGHSNCGAVNGIRHPEKVAGYPAVARWLSLGKPALDRLRRDYPSLTGPEEIKQLTRLNVLTQLENLRTHPAVAAGLAAGTLKLSGFVFEIHTGEVEELTVPS